MKPLESVPNGRDPVAFATEQYLRLIEQDGIHKLSVEPKKAGVRVRFGDQTAEAENFDTALLRLGGMLIRNPAFRETLSNAVRGPGAAEDRRRIRADNNSRE
jgi:hypothetical protein